MTGREPTAGRRSASSDSLLLDIHAAPEALPAALRSRLEAAGLCRDSVGERRAGFDEVADVGPGARRQLSGRAARPPGRDERKYVNYTYRYREDL